MEVEDHFVEVQEGPLVDENYGDNENNLYNQVNKLIIFVTEYITNDYTVEIDGLLRKY